MEMPLARVPVRIKYCALQYKLLQYKLVDEESVGLQKLDVWMT